MVRVDVVEFMVEVVDFRVDVDSSMNYLFFDAASITPAEIGIVDLLFSRQRTDLFQNVNNEF